jgi:hypothetical protein
MASAAALPAAAQDASNAASQAATEFSSVLNRYCVTCHNDRLKTANLILGQLDIEDPPASAPAWEKVIRKLRSGQMPPVGLPRPEPAFYSGFATYLETQLDRASAAHPNPGRPAVHRLNRAEYTNTVRDLLGVEFDSAALLPADDASRGFDNNADILSVSPLLLERYMAAARKISDLAVGDPEIRPFAASYDVSRRLVQDDRMSEDTPFGSRGGIAVRHTFPLDGEYVIKVRLQRNNDNYIKGLGEPNQLDVRLDGARLQLFTVGGEHKGRSAPLYSFINKDYKGDPEQEIYEFTADAGLEVRFQAQAGSRLVSVAFLNQAFEPEGERMPRQLYDEVLSYKGGDPAVDGVTITGPYNAKGLGNTLSRQKIFVCKPDAAGQGALTSNGRDGGRGGQNRNSEDACATKILSTLARRAYRRPVTPAEVETLRKYYQVGYNRQIGSSSGGFEAGITTAIRGLLVSPEFLFRIERDPSSVTPGTPYAVSDLALASRLSFFLWSSIPDEPLLDLAERGRLRDPAVLEQQVKRMLADSRSKALVENFVGQWLGLRKLDSISPDPRVFPDFDDNLREALEQQTMLFAESIAREDRSVLDFLRADYTFLNERLARHYGIPNVYGNSFRRVTLQEEARKGLLGQGSVLTVTSYSNRTSPTLRGKWVLENILGAPPPPPPPDVPFLKEDTGTGGKRLTMRERMSQHRTNPACAVCHARMDPLGFALDNFDAVGRWRDIEGSTPVDPSGVLPDGTKFTGPAELRKILMVQDREFTRTVTEKLLQYAIGRGVEYSDEPAVRQIVREAAPSDYRWSSLVLSIVKSSPFQMRRSREP